MADFQGVIRTTRLVTGVVTLVLVAATAPHPVATWAVTAVLLLDTAARLVRPIRIGNDLRSTLIVIGDVGLQVVAVVMTGYWGSPLVFMLLNAVILAGFSRGYGFAARIAVTATLAVSIPWVVGSQDTRAAVMQSASWATVVLLVAVVAGYARRLHNEANDDRSRAMDQLGQLSDANELLYSLHRVAQSLPESLDLSEVLDTTMQRIRSLLECDGAALILFDETDAQWTIARHHGLDQGGRLGPTELPAGLRRAIAQNDTVHLADLSLLPHHEVPSLLRSARCGIYTVLVARDVIIGLLSVERRDGEGFGPRDVELVEGLVAPASLAVDNARWFARLRTLGADEERSRIARDLHDRLGQSLAYLGIELDRLVERQRVGEPTGEDLERLRDDVRTVTREVRDTLYDLRTDVSSSMPMDQVLEQYTARVTQRSGVQIRVDSEQTGRLPMMQEREMWRIAQEALGNVEKHSCATAVRVQWRCDGERALLDVTDNGVGFEEGVSGRVDSYGVLGMRERAASIGASLEITSALGRGTRVRCVLPASSAPATRRHEPAGALSTIDPPPPPTPPIGDHP